MTLRLLKSIPDVPLSLHTLCLAVGDERIFFPLGGKPTQERAQTPKGVDTTPDGHWQVTDPLIAASITELKKKGVKRHTWNAHPGCCDNCLQNAGQTVDVGKPFKSGALITPEHDHCECGTSEVNE